MKSGIEEPKASDSDVGNSEKDNKAQRFERCTTDAAVRRQTSFFMNAGHRAHAQQTQKNQRPLCVHPQTRPSVFTQAHAREMRIEWEIDFQKSPNNKIFPTMESRVFWFRPRQK